MKITDVRIRKIDGQTRLRAVVPLQSTMLLQFTN